MSSESAFRDSLRSFNTRPIATGSTTPPTFYSKVSGFFSSSSSSLNDGGPSDRQGLLSGFRERSQAAWNGLGWGGAEEQQDCLGLSRWQVIRNQLTYFNKTIFKIQWQRIRRKGKRRIYPTMVLFTYFH